MHITPTTLAVIYILYLTPYWILCSRKLKSLVVKGAD